MTTRAPLKMMSEDPNTEKRSTIWKLPGRYPPTTTRDISVASTFSPLEWMVDIMPMNETDRQYNDKSI